VLQELEGIINCKKIKSMNTVFPKFIVEGDVLVIAKCTYHHQLVNNKKDVKGGGWWRLSEDRKAFILHGESHDFGKASIKDIKDCISQHMVFTDRYEIHNIYDRYNFQYDTGTEIIELKNTSPSPNSQTK
jgi:hypothetical protein